jgi:hypothetical protein
MNRNTLIQGRESMKLHATMKTLRHSRSTSTLTATWWSHQTQGGGHQVILHSG